MRKKQFTLLFTLCLSAMVYAEEFLYPAGIIDSENVLLMHQISQEKLELLIWNPTTKTATKELTSFYIPAQLQLLPGKTSYSFIDRGRIRIKSFCKRAPKTIDIFEPICDIQSMHWINDEQFYFVAKHKEYYKIFMYDTVHLGGSLYALTDLHDEINYIFPSKVGSDLFCITQSKIGSYHFSKITFQPILYDQAKETESKFSQAEILASSNYPLCFLFMQGKSNFVIEMVERNSELKTFTFQCCMIEKSERGWSLNPLFNFIIPEYLIMGLDESRLYESIYPLLPKYFQDKIYFTSFDHSVEKCLLYEHDLSTHQTEPFSSKRSTKHVNQHLFAPIIIADHLYSGCSQDSLQTRRSPLLVDELSGNIECNLPTF